jgi:hypothetical protein
MKIFQRVPCPAKAVGQEVPYAPKLRLGALASGKLVTSDRL